MSLSEYFLPVSKVNDLQITDSHTDSWIHDIMINDDEFPNLTGIKVVLINVINDPDEKDGNLIRNHLYSLSKREYAGIVADAGNFLWDKYDPKIFEKFGFMLSELLDTGKIPVIIAASQEISYAQYLAFDYLKKIMNLVVFDQTIDFGSDPSIPDIEQRYLYRILMKDPTYLFNLSLAGYQSYLTDTGVIELLDKQLFDLHRLGVVRDDIDETEPLIRSADMLSFDMNCIRYADAPAVENPSPNGFTAEEACRIARYAGLSDNLVSAGFYGYIADLDNRQMTARLLAQMIWFFTEGCYFREKEKIIGDEQNFTKYITTENGSNYEVVFYKSKKTARWWMEIPVANKSKDYGSKQLIPCSYRDYLEASKGNVPERWWKAMQKML